MSSRQDAHVVRRGGTWSVLKEGNRRGFLHGIAGLFSFVDVLNRRLLAETAAEADAEALREDWERVGGYLYDAMGGHTWVYTTRPIGSKEKSCQTTTQKEK